MKDVIPMTQQVLVIDDEPDMRIAVSHALCRSGYSVKAASNGNEALTMFTKEDFGIVITDMRMPEMSGLQILGEIKKISPHVPVIMMTAYGTIDNAVAAMKEGASDYIIKPFSAEILESTVEKAWKSLKGHASKNLDKNVSLKAANEHCFVTEDPNTLRLLDFAKNVAPTNSTVLILGESGTGKEMFASYIHQFSGRHERPYVAVNCAALPENLAESELFGHEKGAFTGAANRKLGKFELANNGTIVLDEISEMPIPLQAKLLRTLQEKEIDRVGGSKPLSINARIIAISNVDLKQAVREGKFREDLYYRINVIPFKIPPLRQRRTDIPVLAHHFLKKYCAANNKGPMGLAEETISLLCKQEWKGNVRELENTMERAVIMSNSDILQPEQIFFGSAVDSRIHATPFKAGTSVKEMEKELIFNTLEQVNDNRTHAAKLLGISIRTLRNKLREYRIE